MDNKLFICYFIHSLYIAQMQWYNIDKQFNMLVHQDLEGREL